MKKAKVKKETRGGAREGAGRPKVTDRETTTVSFRVFDDEADWLKAMVKQLLKQRRTGHT